MDLLFDAITNGKAEKLRKLDTIACTITPEPAVTDSNYSGSNYS